ncbi:MAG: enterotoxin [Kiritimatiellae bacterium]|nr:enterotoxin [Kiritimatiellia bacterium]
MNHNLTMRTLTILSLLSAMCCYFGDQTLAMDYPGPLPGPAESKSTATNVILQNSAIAMQWSWADRHLKPDGIWDKHSSTSLSDENAECFYFVLGQTPSPQTRTLTASELKLVTPPKLTPLKANPESAKVGDHFAGWELSARMISTAADIEVVWRAILRDNANYIRQEVTLHPLREPIEVVDVVLIDMGVPRAEVAGQVDGSPVVTSNMFFGVEHPASKSQVIATDDVVRCSYPCDISVTPDESLTLSSVIGVYPSGQQRRGFLCYLERERAYPFHPFLHHNNGEQIGLTYWAMVKNKPVEAEEYRAGQEQKWREIIDNVGRELVEQRGAKIDAFVHDYEWDDENLVWQFHNGFPNGFVPLIETAAKYQSGLGIWFSPWGGYPCKPARVKFGRQRGMETNQGGLSLSGPRYYARFRAACINLMRNHGVKYYKFDGFAGSNSPSDVGEYRSDVEALWRLLRELRESMPDVFINCSSGTWPSPFWLLRSDAIWRGGGDTGISGAKGSERQQWITYRDFEVHNRVLVRGPLYPISSLMIHGIMINNGGRVKTFDERDILDEIRSFFASGVNVQELYIAPELMKATAWDVLAEGAKWSRANADVIADTHWVGGDPAKGQVYGWASWAKRKGILSLRNPSDQPAKFSIDVGQVFELPAGAVQSYSLKSPWKKDATAAPIEVTAGQQCTLDLKPFEILTFDAIPHIR